MKTNTRQTKRRMDSSFSMKCYFKEINRYPLLSREEEIELAQRVQTGDLEARERLINSNLRLVAKIANDYAMYGLDVEDLICEGNIGLLDAVEKFDPTYGVRFSTYSSWWIKRRIKGALGNQSRTIRLPLHVLQKLRDIERAEVRAITEPDAKDELGIPASKIAALRRVSQPMASLDDRSSDDGVDYQNVGAVIPDESVILPSDAAVDKERVEDLRRVLSVLNPREREVIVSRFGIVDGEPQTLEEIG
ncbi:MAG: sigma-70 family RNA polymerase sigma factor, partial [Verrucomicrobiales bacterium]